MLNILKDEKEVKEYLSKNNEEFVRAINAFRGALYEYDRAMLHIASDARSIMYSAEMVCSDPKLLSAISVHQAKMSYQCYSAMNIIPHVLSSDF